MRFVCLMVVSAMLAISAQAAKVYRFTYGFSKAGVSRAAWMSDRADCLGQSRKERLFTVEHAPYRLDSYDAVHYRQCLAARGYTAGDRGFQTSFRGLAEPKAGEYVALAD